MIVGRVIHLLVDLGWIYFDLGVPLSCPAAQPLLPNFHLPKQNLADGGTTKIKVNTTQVSGQMNHPVMLIRSRFLEILSFAHPSSPKLVTKTKR